MAASAAAFVRSTAGRLANDAKTQKHEVPTVLIAAMLPQEVSYGFGVRLGDGPGAVSYTHLDVYKRQAWGMSSMVLSREADNGLVAQL